MINRVADHFKHPFCSSHNGFEIPVASKVQSVATGIIVGTLLAGTFIAVYFLAAKITLLTLLIAAPSTAIIGGTTSFYALAFFKKRKYRKEQTISDTYRTHNKSQEPTKISLANAQKENDRYILQEIEDRRIKNFTEYNPSMKDSIQLYTLYTSKEQWISEGFTSRTSYIDYNLGYFQKGDAEAAVEILKRYKFSASTRISNNTALLNNYQLPALLDK